MNALRYPKKGAGKKWAARLKEIGQRPISERLQKKLQEYAAREREIKNSASSKELS